MAFGLPRRIGRKVDPFTLPEAERLIRALHLEWGEAIGNYLCPGQSASTGIVTYSGGDLTSSFWAFRQSFGALDSTSEPG